MGAILPCARGRAAGLTADAPLRTSISSGGVRMGTSEEMPALTLADGKAAVQALSASGELTTADGTVHMAQRSDIEAKAAGIDYPVILCGHTHIQRAVRLSDGRLVVNPGSVGCPGYDDDQPVPHKVEAGSPDARYAIVEQTVSGWHVTFRNVPYDWMAMSRLAASRNRMEWEKALATGFLD